MMKEHDGTNRSRTGNDAALHAVNFDIIRYANCWEDAGMLLGVLQHAAPGRVAIVSSAGDNALACLAADPVSVTAFDISRPQLYLTELKQHAFGFLEHGELLTLLGVGEARPGERLALLRHLEGHLPAACRRYWQEHRQYVARGVIHSGRFENYFRIFRQYCLPLVHSKKTIRALFALRSAEELRTFYHGRWNNLRWKLLMHLFFSRYFMGRAGRDPQFLKQVEIPVAAYIRERTELHLQSPVAMQNHFLQYVFTGNFSTLLPHYLRPELHAVIRANLGRMTVREAAAETIVQDQRHDTYCLSNIFEYYPRAAFEATVRNWSGLLQSGARLLFWNLMVPRSFAAAAPYAFESCGIPDRDEDAGFFYSAFRNEQRR